MCIEISLQRTKLCIKQVVTRAALIPSSYSRYFPETSCYDLCADKKNQAHPPIVLKNLKSKIKHTSPVSTKWMAKA